MKRKLFINGMSCMHCVRRVQNALKNVEGVTEAEVDLEGRFAIIELAKEVPDEILKKAVEEAGYEVAPAE